MLYKLKGSWDQLWTRTYFYIHASTWNPLHFLMLHAFQAVLWFCLLQVLLIRKNVPNYNKQTKNPKPLWITFDRILNSAASPTSFFFPNYFFSDTGSCFWSALLDKYLVSIESWIFYEILSFSCLNSSKMFNF